MAKVNEVNELLDRLNPTLFGPESRLKLAYVRFEDVREQDINANVMPVGMFNALVSNVSKHGALESIPLCATREGSPDVVEVVSGHHRTRAARAAGIEGGVVLLYEGLTNGEIRAKQLAHNSISGSSDAEVVKAIFEQIDELDDRMESFIDPSVFEGLPQAVKFDMVDIDLKQDMRTATVVFLPTQISDFQQAVDELTDHPDVVYLAGREAFDGFREALLKVKEEMEIVSQPTAFATMARLAMERLEQLREGGLGPGPEIEAVAMGAEAEAEAEEEEEGSGVEVEVEEEEVDEDDAALMQALGGGR